VKDMEKALQVIQKHYHNVQGVYLFGTFQTEYERSKSDIDIAILFSPEDAKKIGQLPFSELCDELKDLYSRHIDLINIRIVDTVFQNEIITNGRIILKADGFAVEEFEMMTLSKYLKLNDERSAIIKDIYQNGNILQ
jgi:uncharacterized protein